METDRQRELEVKFWLLEPELITEMLVAEAELIQPRTEEFNLRFDREDESLKRMHKVLRLRKDQSVRLTYKGPGRFDSGVHDRREIELVVDDFETARHFFEALGYTVSMVYEKYRTTFSLKQVQIVLDEMPYGNFLELEGPDPESIQTVCQYLGLNWEARILDSYTGIFEQLRSELGLEFTDLTFANFQNIPVSLSRLNFIPADN